MGSDDIVSSLIESLESSASSDGRLRAAVIREEAVTYLEQGLAVEGLIDLSPLRHHLLDKGAPNDLVIGAMAQLSSIAASAGLTPSSPPSIPSPAGAGSSAEQAPELDGFISGADIRRENEKLDRVLVSVVVRNADLNVDMEQFRDHLIAALNAARQTGTVDLEALYNWLTGTGSTETACRETLLALVSLGAQAKTRYQLSLPNALKALPEGQQKEILDAFNKRCPPETQPTPQPRGPRSEEKKAAPPAWMPPKPDDKKGKSSFPSYLILLFVLLAGGGGFWFLNSEAQYEPAGDALKLPAGTMPCTQLLKRGKGIFCGIKATTWTALSQSQGAADVKDMKQKTVDAAKSAGFSGVSFGLDTSH
jgi:hypothetical protein